MDFSSGGRWKAISCFFRKLPRQRLARWSRRVRRRRSVLPAGHIGVADQEDCVVLAVEHHAAHAHRHRPAQQEIFVEEDGRTPAGLAEAGFCIGVGSSRLGASMPQWRLSCGVHRAVFQFPEVPLSHRRIATGTAWISKRQTAFRSRSAQDDEGMEVRRYSPTLAIGGKRLHIRHPRAERQRSERGDPDPCRTGGDMLRRCRTAAHRDSEANTKNPTPSCRS